MQISSRFTIAIHLLICIETFRGQYKLTSEFLASSIGVNPVVVRRIIQQLKDAGIITVQRGSGGADTARKLNDITLLDVYQAVESVEKEGLFHFHENPNPLCPVGRNIHAIMDKRLLEIQQAMEEKMRSVTLQEVMEDAKGCLESRNRK